MAKKTGVSNLLRQASQELKVTQKQQDSEGVEDLYGVDTINKPKIFNVMEYIEQPWGLGMKLYPVQKFIVKLYYHIPLEAVEKTIKVTDMFNSKVLHHFTEVEYLRHLHKEGRCNIGEQDHERRVLILACGRRAGKCCSAGTLVPTDNGIFRIEELGTAPEEDATPTDIGIVQEGGRRARATSFYNGGVKTTFKITTDSGYFIGGTENHRVKVLSTSGCVEWRYCDEIQTGDVICIHRTSDLWASELVDLRPYHNKDGWKEVELPSFLDEKVGNLIGYLVGDGSWGSKCSTAITVEHPETWEHLRSLFNEVLGEPRIQLDLRTQRTGRIEFCGVRARRFFEELGWISSCTVDTKMIPWSILRSPKQVVCAFLRGLFEADGCAESGGRMITFSSASFRLAHEVQTVLLNMGIVSNVASKWVSKTKKNYAVLSIKGVRSRRKFAELIGFDSEKKRLPMLAALKVAQEGKSNTESIPFQRELIQSWLNSVSKKDRAIFRKALGNTYKPSSVEDLTYTRLQRAVSVAKEVGADSGITEHFENLLRLDYFYDPVKSVELNQEQVYDLTVPDGEAFVANGMTNHNTTLSGIFASYEVYRLLNLDNPQAFYGLPNGNRIQIISIATDKDQASLLFNEVSSHVSRCEYFKTFIANNTQSHIQFRTPYDISRYGPVARQENGKFVSFSGKATLRVTFRSSIAKGLRGSGNIIIILDEMAHFLSKGQSSAEDIYNAVTPSAAAFSPKGSDGLPLRRKDGTTYPVESRTICISSPLNRQGKFYELYQQALAGGEAASNMLAIQAPTWEINPTIEPSYYRQKFHENAAVFMTEHGAQFSDRVRGWIERASDLQACIDLSLRPKETGVYRQPHFMGIDIGLMGDGSAIAVCHLEDGKIVLDYHEIWYAKTSWKESNPHLTHYSVPYVKELENVDRLDFDEIADWIQAITKRFYIVEGVFDRWNGIPLEQKLQKKGLRQFHSDYFTRDEGSKMYQNMKEMMMDSQLSLYDYPIKDDKHSPLIQEILDLQAENVARNVILVAAPKMPGKHDDMSDAVCRAIFLASKNISTYKKAAFGGTHSRVPGESTANIAAQMARYKLKQMRSALSGGNSRMPLRRR